MQRQFTRGLKTVVPLRAATALRRRLRQPRPHEPFILETIQRGVDSAERNSLWLRELLDMTMDRDAVGVIAEGQHSSQDDLLKLTN
jgi:hypothetical protein